MAVSPWTWSSREPEMRGHLSAAWEDFGGLSRSCQRNPLYHKCLSNFLLLQRRAPPGRIQRSARALEICGLSGSPVRTGEGRHRAT